MKQLHVFIFYLALIVVLASYSYSRATEDKRVVNGLTSALVGVVISFALWHFYGREHSTVY